MFFTKTSFCQDWELQKEDNGILVYTRDNGTRYRSVQVVTVINTSMSEAVAMIMNVERFPEWVYKCRAARTLERRSETELIHYQVNSVPLAKDRDMVVHLLVKEDVSGDVVITQKALPDYIPFEKDLVRIPKFDGIWNLKTVANGVEINYTIDADPGGDLPMRFVNKAMIEGPFSTTYNLKRLLEQKQIAKKKL